MGSGSDWKWWWRWVVANTVSWGLAWAIASLVGNLHLVAGGLLVGAAQWLVVRGHLPRASWWIPATGVGWLGMWSTGYFVFYAGGLVH